MNKSVQAEQQNEAEKIWAQLDAEETGGNVSETISNVNKDDQSAAAQEVSAASPAPAAAEDTPAEIDPEKQALLDKINGLESLTGRLESRLRNAEGHIGSLNGQLKQQLNAAKQVTASGGDAPTADEIRDAQRSPQAMATLKEDYPQFAAVLEPVLTAHRAEMQQLLEQRPAAPEQTVTPDQIEQLRAELTVEQRHPGWQDRARAPEFQGWLHRQPREVQMLAASPYPQDAIRLFDLHNTHLEAQGQQRNQQRISSAAAIPTARAGSAIRQKPVEDMTKEELWAYHDELDRQKSRG